MRIRGFKNRYKETLYKEDGRNKNITETSGDRVISRLHSFSSRRNPSITATAVRKKEKEMGVKPGDKEWFKLWFSKPYMTGTPKFRGRKKK